MEKIKCIIIDDEYKSAEGLAALVRQMPELDLVEVYTDPFVAKKALENSDIALVFSDINMDELSGMELAETIEQKVVFTTGHRGYAFASWELGNVIGFLKKPILISDIVKVLNERIIPILSTEISTTLDTEEKLSYKLDGKIIEVPYDKILYLETAINYTNIQSELGERFAPIPLWELERGLPKSIFVRVGKSTIVNKNKVTGFSDNYKEVEFMGGLKCKSSKHYIQNADF